MRAYLKKICQITLLTLVLALPVSAEAFQFSYGLRGQPSFMPQGITVNYVPTGFRPYAYGFGLGGLGYLGGLRYQGGYRSYAGWGFGFGPTYSPAMVRRLAAGPTRRAISEMKQRQHINKMAFAKMNHYYHVKAEIAAQEQKNADDIQIHIQDQKSEIESYDTPTPKNTEYLEGETVVMNSY